ncbi:TadE/TadG family type IV pilus assembly protein [Eubacterium xylanophilum]|uniref:TadE/TadG family type IV pilus assembly protein n=1 Tax=Eubacterium xylanophilum TaxID=39497 RepID=UPI00047BA09D|nr:TadE/TadG family type IV pilus assembly protein [Eubacterium xylanophilum]
MEGFGFDVKMQGSFTVEMSLVLPMIICIIFLIIYGGFYTHDMAVIDSYGESVLEVVSQEKSLNDVDSYENRAVRWLNRSLIISKVEKVDITDKVVYWSENLIYRFEVTFPFSNFFGFGKEQKQNSYFCPKDRRCELMWDKSIVDNIKQR